MSLDISLSAKIDTGGKEPYEVYLYDANYTHNVTSMWRKAGVYDALYNSDGDVCAEWITVLASGLEQMQDDPQGFEKLNPSNGWGSYDTAVVFLFNFLGACRQHPKAIIHISK